MVYNVPECTADQGQDDDFFFFFSNKIILRTGGNFYSRVTITGRAVNIKRIIDSARTIIIVVICFRVGVRVRVIKTFVFRLRP